jgi:hypothetical protein
VAGRRVRLQPGDHVEHEPGVAVGDVRHEDVDAGLDQRRGALPRVAEVADRRADQQPPVGVLGGVRVLLRAHEVLDGDEPGQPARVVDQRQPLALVLAQDRRGVLARDADRRGDERQRRHHVGDQRGRPLGDRHEAQVAVGDHAEQGLSSSTTGRPGDAVLPAELVQLLEGGLGPDRDRPADHAGLGALHEVDLVGLVLDRQVAVQDPDAALAAMAMAMRDSVTVSIALDMSGMRSDSSRVSRVGVSTSLGTTSVSPGAGARRRRSGRAGEALVVAVGGGGHGRLPSRDRRVILGATTPCPRPHAALARLL